MANKGTWNSKRNGSELRFIIFEWKATPNLNAGTGVIDWVCKCGSSKDGGDDLYYLLNSAKGQNTLSINGNTMFTYPVSEYRNGHTIYNGYVYPGSFLDGRDYYDTNGDWTGIQRWVHGIGTLGKGRFNYTYDSNGDYNFTVNGHFGWYSANFGVDINENYRLDRIDLYTKIQKTSNSGSNWNKTAYVYKTTDGGRTWKKCFVYRTNNSGANWEKMTS